MCLAVQMSESLLLQKHQLVRKVYSNTFHQVLSKGNVLCTMGIIFNSGLTLCISTRWARLRIYCMESSCLVDIVRNTQNMVIWLCPYGLYN